VHCYHSTIILLVFYPIQERCLACENHWGHGLLLYSSFSQHDLVRLRLEGNFFLRSSETYGKFNQAPFLWRGPSTQPWRYTPGSFSFLQISCLHNYCELMMKRYIVLVKWIKLKLQISSMSAMMVGHFFKWHHGFAMMPKRSLGLRGDGTRWSVYLRPEISPVGDTLEFQLNVYRTIEIVQRGDVLYQVTITSKFIGVTGRGGTFKPFPTMFLHQDNMGYVLPCSIISMAIHLRAA
jgi:hypothetical protein